MELRAENLSMSYSDASREVEVFRGLNVKVPSGSSLAVVGESGVGKTTLLYLLGGLEVPRGGDVFFGDESVVQAQRNGDAMARLRGRHVGFVFQFHQLLPEFDAQENVAMPLLIRGMSQNEARTQAAELLKRVGLGHRLDHRPAALSGGEQQRVAIARAFVGRPGVVLADEPTGNLDVKTSSAVQDLLLELQREQGITLVVVTHSLELARRLDRVMELKAEGLREMSER